VNVADRLLVLTWHAIDLLPSVISMPPAAFRGQMEALAQRSLRGVSLAQAFEQREREGRFPHDAVVLTFDDGYLSVMTEGLPVLAAQGFTATVFLASGLVGLTAAEARRRNPDIDRDLLDWRQAAELLQAGCEIGDSKLELEQRLQAPDRFARLLDDGLVVWLKLRRMLRAVNRLAQAANRIDPDTQRLKS
jgi:hypothetical protein